MSVFTRHSKWFVLIVLFVFVAVAAVVYADTVRNDVVVNVNDFVYANGVSTLVVDYHIEISNAGGDRQLGCNAADGTGALLTFGNLNPNVIVTPASRLLSACDENSPATFTFSSSVVGNYEISVAVTDTGGGAYNTSPAKFTLRVLAVPDSTPPVITPIISDTLGLNSWHIDDVSLSWSITDPESGIISSTGCDAVSVIEDTTGTTYTCTATSLGGESSQSVTIKRDATAPSINGSATPNAVWTNQDVTVSFVCNDTMSGLASCSLPTTLTGEGANQSVLGTAVDNAGNSATFTVGGINIDKTAPLVSAAAAPLANAAGWNNTDVTVSFTCSDGLSGLAGVCPSPITLTGEGMGLSAGSGLVSDLAGNTASASVSNINIDKTAPSISGSAAPAPNLAGWNNTPVTVSFDCDDALSLIASCSTDTVLSSDGIDQSVLGTAVDAAGNTATATVGNIDIDQTAPFITGSRTPVANANGWNNTDVTVSFLCADGGGSPVVSCTSDQLVGEGAAQSRTGYVMDAAGNTAQATVSNINVDKTAPTITGAATTSPNANGWYNTDVVLQFTCADPLSGVDAATCQNVTVTSEGLNQGGTGSVSDLAGNTATASVASLNIDKTNPTITRNVSGTAGTNGWYISAVMVSYICDDALSGVDTCSDDQNFGEGAGQNASGTVTDLAGNSASTDTLVLNIDLTAPTVTGSRTPDANANGWNNSDVTVSFECVDALSGIVDCPTDSVVSSEGENQSVDSGLVYDNAGNSSSDVVENISIDKTDPTITRNVTGTAGTNGWYVSAVTVSYTCDDTLSGVDTCSEDQNFGEGAGQNASGTVTDKAGNSVSTDTLVLNIDLTAPTVTGSRTPDANAYGWNNDNVTVSFECVDTLSGIVDCPPDTVVSSEGEGQSVDSGLVYDAAGNSSSDVVININIDKSAPVVIGSREPDANANGWNNEDVTVTFTCSDAVSEVVACPPPTVVSAEGDNLSVDSGPVYDLAGNSSSDVVTGIKIDKTVPVVTGSRAPLANSDGWNNGAVIISFTCTDGGSGIVLNGCPASTTLSGEGAGQSVNSGLVYDLAGNSSSATISGINIDLTNPTISGTASPAANGFGWNNSNVTVTFTCNDALSTIKTCDSPVVLSSEGAAQSASGTATDKAGNSASTSVNNINIDKTAPTVTVTGVSNGAVYILGTVPVAACTTTDALSGVNVSAAISTQETDGLINGVGSFTATCSGASDKAGNTGTVSVSYTVTYNFSGFTAPVDNPPVVNTVRAGSAVPIKFGLGGNHGLNIMQGNATVVRVNCSTSAPTDAIETTVTAGNSSLSYDATTGLYTYVWKTARNLSGCYQFTLNLNDGTQRIAIFNFR